MSVLSPASFSINVGSDDPSVTPQDPTARAQFTTRIPTLIGLVPERSHWGVSLGSLTLWPNPTWISDGLDIFVNLSIVQSSIVGSQITQTLYVIPIDSINPTGSPQQTVRPFEVTPLYKQTISDLRYVTSITVTLTNSEGRVLAPVPAYAAAPLTQYVTRLDLSFSRLG